jgi:hypothetical protein
MRNMCEGKIANECRDAYSLKLDQAPYKPKGMVLGTTPRVLALSNGAGDRADAICWAYVDENGRVLENGKFTDMRLGNAEKYTSDGKDVAPSLNLSSAGSLMLLPSLVGLLRLAASTKICKTLSKGTVCKEPLTKTLKMTVRCQTLSKSAWSTMKSRVSTTHPLVQPWITQAYHRSQDTASRWQCTCKIQ